MCPWRPIGRRIRVTPIQTSGWSSQGSSRTDWSHGCYLADHQVLAGVPRLASIPAVLIHGRRDFSGPFDTALSPTQRLASSRLVMLDDAGHFPGQLTAALDTFRELRSRAPQ